MVNFRELKVVITKTADRIPYGVVLTLLFLRNHTIWHCFKTSLHVEFKDFPFMLNRIQIPLYVQINVASQIERQL